MTGSDICKRYESMDDYVTSNWMNLWQECADWVMPTNDNINHVRTPGTEKPPQRLIDVGIEANFNFASGFFSHIFPPNTVWAKYRHPSPEMMQNKNVANYFEEVSRIIHGVLIGSNFAQEEFQSLLGMGCFGTSCVAVEEDKDSVVRFRDYIVSKIRISENHQGIVDTVARKFTLDARQAIQKFGKEALDEAGQENILLDAEHHKNTKYDFIHLVVPRSDFDKEKKDKKNKPWASYYVSLDREVIVSEGGFDYIPYKVARFVTGNDEVYGRGPCSMKLGALRRTNVIYRSTVLSYEQAVNNQWLVSDDDVIAQRSISQRANAMIKFRAGGPGGPPTRLDANGNPLAGKELMEHHENEIRRMFFNHLFRPLEDYRNMTATEVNERMTSDLMVLAPFVSRYIDEKISPLMEHVYYICQKQKKLPAPPAELKNDANFSIDYVGRLSLATKNFETLGATNVLRMMAELSQAVPSAQEFFDNVDMDKLGIEMWFSQSASMNALRDPAEVEELREERAQKQQQQQMVDNLAPVADAAQKLSGGVDPSSMIAQMGE